MLIDKEALKKEKERIMDIAVHSEEDPAWLWKATNESPDDILEIMDKVGAFESLVTAWAEQKPFVVVIPRLVYEQTMWEPAEYEDEEYDAKIDVEEVLSMFDEEVFKCLAEKGGIDYVLEADEEEVKKLMFASFDKEFEKFEKDMQELVGQRMAEEMANRDPYEDLDPDAMPGGHDYDDGEDYDYGEDYESDYDY